MTSAELARRILVLCADSDVNNGPCEDAITVRLIEDLARNEVEAK